MLDADDKQFLKLLVSDLATTKANDAVDHHTEVTHKPLDTRVAEAHTAADKATEAAGGARKFVLAVVVVCIAIGAGLSLITGG